MNTCILFNNSTHHMCIIIKVAKNYFQNVGEPNCPNKRRKIYIASRILGANRGVIVNYSLYT